MSFSVILLSFCSVNISVLCFLASVDNCVEKDSDSLLNPPVTFNLTPFNV